MSFRPVFPGPAFGPRRPGWQPPTPPAPSTAAAAAFPSAVLDLRCDIDLGAGWTDVTSYVLQRDRDSPVTITRGRPDEAGQVNPSAAEFEVNNRDGRWTVLNPSGPWYGQLSRNTPVRFSVPASANYLRMEDDATSYASAPDSAALSITGDTEVQVDMHLSDYQACLIASKYLTASKSWALYLNGSGTLTFQFNDGSVVHAASSTVPLPVGRIAVKVTLDVDNGASGHVTTFYTASSIAGTWSQLGDAVTGTGAITVFDSTAAVVVGYVSGFAADNAGYNGCLGAVYGLKVLSGIGGTVRAYADFTSATAGLSPFTDAYGNAWTVHGTAYVSDRDYRFHGELSSLPVSWDSSGTDVWAEVAAGGLLRRLGQGSAPLYSPMKRAVLNLSGTLAPVAYWPCEDLSGSTSIGTALGGGQAMTVNGSPTFAADTSFACSDAMPTIGSSSWYGVIPNYTSNGSLVVRFLLDVTSGPATGTRIIRIITTGTCKQFSLYYSSGGALGLAGYDSTSTAVFDTGAVSFNVDGSPRWVSMELRPNGGNVNYSITTLVPGATTGTASSGTFAGTVGKAKAVYVNPNQASCSVGLGHITVQSDWQSLFGLYWPLYAWQGETAAARFARLCGENGLTARIYGPPSTSAAMGAQTVASLTTLLQECETADMGMMYEPRGVLGLGYRPLAALLGQSAAVTLAYDSAELGGTSGGGELKPTYDDQYTHNDVTVTRTNGASYRATLADGSAMSVSAPPTGVGDYTNSVTANVKADGQLSDVAGWLVNLGTVNGFRWPEIPVNMARSAVAAAAHAMQAADVGDHLQITGLPAWLPPDTVKQLIAQTAEVLGGYHWEIKASCVPESPYEAAIYDDATYGRCDTDGSTLAAAVTSGGTSLSVATADSTTPAWTTAAADFPFDIAIGGERITVTGISGTSSPQTFTVTRAVNGVSKAHASGSDVRLWTAPVYSVC